MSWRIGPPAVGIAQMFAVAPSISGSASQLPSGDRLPWTNDGDTGTRSALMKPIGSAGPSSGDARQMVQPTLEPSLDLTAK